MSGRTLLFCGIGFLIGFGGATAGVTLREAPARPSAGALRDTASAGAARADTGAIVDAGAADSTATAVAGRAATPAQPEAAARPPTPVLDAAIASARRRAATGPAGAHRAPAPPPGDEGPARLAKIFGAMEPEDAARVLELLDDNAIQAILLELADRKAAAILGSIEPARAASISRAVLAGGAE